uniref:Uncharacterized protein n=1 Tax=Meloidogyne enterolobii TaxID=390850 RepID=A0A6V7W9H1_MELEN|nr:unnamed protein product [Meloidogyne enterolobii]CAD2204930.1 unnamed protein product [Meloidogyne enterolobii]
MTERFKLVFGDCTRIVHAANIKYELIKEISNEYFGSNIDNLLNNGSRNIVNVAEINVDDAQADNIIDKDNIPLGIPLTNKDEIPQIEDDKNITGDSKGN